jgi:hypothetical protein
VVLQAAGAVEPVTAVRRVLDRPLRTAVLLASAAAGVRLLMLPAPARPDEAGYLLVARYAGSGGPHLYGELWVDRPPLLVAFFRAADALGGLTAVRLLTLLPVVVVVLAACSAGRTLGGPRGGLAAGAVAAALSTTPLLSAPELNGELLAAPFVMAGCAVGLRALAPDRSGTRQAWAVLLAGAVGAAALLVKQNFVDALVLLAVVVLARTARGQLPVRRGAVLLGCLAAGALVPVALAVAWAGARGVAPVELWQVLLAFRSESLAVIASSDLGPPSRRAVELAVAGTTSGVLPLLVLVAAVQLRARPVPDVAVGLLAMWAVALLSIALGGSYWTHYATQLLPAAALSAAVLAAGAGRGRSAGRVLTGLVVASAVAALAVHLPGTGDRGCQGSAGAREVSRWLARHAEPGDTTVTAYGGANALLGSGTRPGYPYLWSLPVRVLDPELDVLVDAVSGPSAAVWVVQSLPLRSWGLDAERRLRSTLREDYSVAAVVCDRRIHLRDGLQRPPVDRSADPAPPPPADGSAPGGHRGDQRAGQRRRGEALLPEPGPRLLGRQPGQQEVGAQRGVLRAGFPQQQRAVLAPQGVRAGPQPGAGRGGLRHEDEVELPVDQQQVGRDEGLQPLDGRGAGAQRRRAAQHRRLQLALPLVEQGDGQPALVGEPAVQGALADAGSGGDVVHGHAGHPALGEQPLGSCQDAQPVAGGVRPLAQDRLPEHRQLPTRRVLARQARPAR